MEPLNQTSEPPLPSPSAMRAAARRLACISAMSALSSSVMLLAIWAPDHSWAREGVYMLALTDPISLPASILAGSLAWLIGAPDGALLLAMLPILGIARLGAAFAMADTARRLRAQDESAIRVSRILGGICVLHAAGRVAGALLWGMLGGYAILVLIMSVPVIGLELLPALTAREVRRLLPATPRPPREYKPFRSVDV